MRGASGALRRIYVSNIFPMRARGVFIYMGRGRGKGLFLLNRWNIEYWRGDRSIQFGVKRFMDECMHFLPVLWVLKIVGRVFFIQ